MKGVGVENIDFVSFFAVLEMLVPSTYFCERSHAGAEGGYLSQSPGKHICPTKTQVNTMH